MPLAYGGSAARSAPHSPSPGLSGLLLEQPGSRFTAVPSHVVLVLGGVGLVWLVVAALLVLETDRGAGAPAPALPPAAEAAPSRAPADGVPSAPTSLPTPTPVPPVPAPEEPAPPAPQEAHPTLPPSLRSALDEPVLLELTALLKTVHADLDGPDARFSPALTAYIGALTHRMNSHGETFVASVFAPEPQAARRRAAHLHALLVEAGLRPWLLEVFGGRGANGVSVERS
jgi:hypothetical protein